MEESKKNGVSSTKGWNWGNYKLEADHMTFNVNGQKCFIINYKDIALSNASGKNEVALEFQQETPESKKLVYICFLYLMF
jgi:hypothetical protein